MILIDKHKHQEIQHLLNDLEKTKNIKIIHAVESGSRAWGFPSKDSDYDVRIIYFHEQEWYISPFDKKDTLEIPITDDLDIAGWDVAKTLSLLYKGNATIHEWVNSPIVYYSNPKHYPLLHDFIAQEFNASPAFYHYISLAKKKLFDDQTRFNAKFFLYGLRALLCAKWILDNKTAPPVLFDKLSTRYLNELHMSDLQAVLRDKAEQQEKDSFEIPHNLWEYSMEMYEKVSASCSTKKNQGKQRYYEDILRKIVMS